MVNSTKLLRRPAAKIAVEWRSAALAVKAVGLLVVGLLVAVPASAANCRLSLSQPLIDYGQLRVNEGAATQGSSLGKRMVRLSVACSEASVIALRFNGAAADEQSYRFGGQGTFNLILEHPELDGKPVELAQLYSRADRSAQLHPGQSLVALASGVPAKGHTFSAQVRVESWLSRAVTAVRDKTTLEGSGRFELVPAG
jgi:hypothetical protein